MDWDELAETSALSRVPRRLSFIGETAALHEASLRDGLARTADHRTA